MTETNDLLLEIGTEELPPRALPKLSAALHSNLRSGLEQANLQHGEIIPFAAPRRLALLVKDLQTHQADKAIERRGPALASAFDQDGNASKAAQGFAASCGVDVAQLDKMETTKGAWLVFRTTQSGQASRDLIPDILQHALDALPIPKRMRWGNLDDQFVRPVHWVVLLFGDAPVDATILSVVSGRETHGHRFHHPQGIHIPLPTEYEMLLETTGKVIPRFDRRRQAIQAQVEETAHQVNGQAVIDPALLDEVTSMVEWPVALLGSFEKHFLRVPQEVLISTMKANQKYFHLMDSNGQLMPYFIAISNIESKDPTVVLAGNERVIRPRFADAEFFWDQDRKTTLASKHKLLENVVFQKKLGTLHEKSQRTMHLSQIIAVDLQAPKPPTLLAAKLCKCDLMTEMVGEFPELQGVMGRYYALHDGEPEEVATAIDEHYLPRFAGDRLPTSAIGQSVAIADRLDTLVGIFGIGQAPSGDKDPFALRRAALGVMRIIIERQLDLDLMKLLQLAVAAYAEHTSVHLAKQTATEVYDYMLERLRAYYHDQGIRPEVFEAVRVLRPPQPLDFHARIQAVTQFGQRPEAESLAAANKRISNILKQAREKNIPIGTEIKKSLLGEAEEKTLASALQELAKGTRKQISQRNYAAVLAALSALKEPVDQFFDQVMVMVDDAKLRNNRLALLNQLRNAFLEVADISHLQQ